MIPNLLLPVSEEHLSVSGEILWASEERVGVRFNPSDGFQERTVENLVDMI